jgi:hypothetical protein
MRSSRMIPAIIACKVNRDANADIQGNAPCAGARELYGRFCRQRLAPTNPAIFFRQFSAESAPQIRYYAESAAVMRFHGGCATGFC